SYLEYGGKKEEHGSTIYHYHDLNSNTFASLETLQVKVYNEALIKCTMPPSITVEIPNQANLLLREITFAYVKLTGNVH
ncbi:hypothetical protein VIGAN_03153000, partial [Vigna angularis var. angularis]